MHTSSFLQMDLHLSKLAHGVQCGKMIGNLYKTLMDFLLSLAEIPLGTNTAYDYVLAHNINSE